MGRRGPPRKPDEQKVLEGNPGNKSLNDRLPMYDPAEIVAPPDDLGEQGKELWMKQSGMMIQHEVLRKTDLPILYSYCKAWDDLKFQEKLLDGFKRMRKLDFFAMRMMLTVQSKVIALRSNFRHFAQELGLTPASRSAVQGKKRTKSAQKAEQKGSGGTGGNTARFFNRQTAVTIPGGKTGTNET